MPKASDYINLQPKQLECYQYIGKGYRILYGGARGGGKSWLGLASAILVARQFPGIKIGIFRRHLSELQENFIDKMQVVAPPDVFKYRYKDMKKTAYFRNGSKIIFRAADREEDVQKILGLEYQYMIVDEANQFSERSVQRMLGSLRNPNIPLWKPTILMTANPGGISDNWFKSHFVNPNYNYWSVGELTAKDQYIYIPATVHDNQILVQNDPEYLDKLESLDDNLRRAWLEGDWDVFEGRFFSEWSEDVHTIEPFDIPGHWRKICGIDIGGSDRHPSVCVWLAQDPETNDVYVYREYVSTEVDEEFALGVAVYSKDEFIDAYYIDTSAFTNPSQKHTDESTAKIFLTTAGIVVTGANKDRVNGWRVFKNWLHWGENKEPKLRFFRNCQNCIVYLPQLLYAKADGLSEDCNTIMRDDEADAIRYALNTGFGFPDRRDVYQPPEIIDNYDNLCSRFTSTDFADMDANTNSYQITYNNGTSLRTMRSRY